MRARVYVNALCLCLEQGWVGISQAGLATMAAGLLVEGVADWQKSRFKMKEKDNFISRCLEDLVDEMF